MQSMRGQTTNLGIHDSGVAEMSYENNNESERTDNGFGKIGEYQEVYVDFLVNMVFHY